MRRASISCRACRAPSEVETSTERLKLRLRSIEIEQSGLPPIPLKVKSEELLGLLSGLGVGSGCWGGVGVGSGVVIVYERGLDEVFLWLIVLVWVRVPRLRDERRELPPEMDWR